MRVYFDYPLATEENLKAVQAAIDSGKTADELDDMFGSEIVWDCVAVLSGNRETAWAVLDDMEGNRQTIIENWQYDFINDYIAKSLTLQSKLTPLTTPWNGVGYAIGIQDKVLVVFDCDGSCDDYEGLSWDYCLLDTEGNEIDAGGQYDDEEMPLGKMIDYLLKEYNLSTDCNWKLCDFDYYHNL